VASNEEVRSIGYSIYYTVVNVGGALGPLLGAAVVASLGMEGVFRYCAVVMFTMVVFVLVLFHEPGGASKRRTTTLRQAAENSVLVLRNWRFVLFLGIFAGYWVTFYAFYVIMPTYVHRYVAPGMSDASIGRLLSIDPLMIIAFQVLISHVTRRVVTIKAIITGVVLGTLSMLTLSAHRSIWMAVAALVVFSLGEMTLAPRYYEYVSRLAPEGQQGVFMGYAFLPIALGYFIAGQLGGHLLHYYGGVVNQPNRLWWVLAGVGAVTALLMAAYNHLFVSGPAREPAP
jgi:MFS family permease